MTLKEDMVGTDRWNGKYGWFMIHGHFKVRESRRNRGIVMLIMYVTISGSSCSCGGSTQKVTGWQHSGRTLWAHCTTPPVARWVTWWCHAGTWPNQLQIIILYHHHDIKQPNSSFLLPCSYSYPLRMEVYTDSIRPQAFVVVTLKFTHVKKVMIYMGAALSHIFFPLVFLPHSKNLVDWYDRGEAWGLRRRRRKWENSEFLQTLLGLVQP